MKITEAPVIQRFLKDVGESAEVNQSISDLYELRIAIQKIRPKYNRLLEEGRYQEADDFLEEDGDILRITLRRIPNTYLEKRVGFSERPC